MEGLNRARVRNPFWFRWLRLIAKRFGLLEVAHAVFSPLGALGASLPGFLALPALYLAKERGLLHAEQAWSLGILLGTFTEASARLGLQGLELVSKLRARPVTYPNVDGHEEGFRVKMVEGVLPVRKHSTPLFSHPRGWGQVAHKERDNL